MALGKPNGPERLPTVGEVADAMRVNQETGRRWLRLAQRGDPGGLRGVQLGHRGAWRIRASDLEAFLQERSAQQNGG
jgi:hypothetical protein